MIVDVGIRFQRRQPQAFIFAGVEAVRMKLAAENPPKSVNAATAADIQQRKRLPFKQAALYHQGGCFR
jgi:hypothetical protein